MARDIIVRKARKDYVCDCCGHIIHAGTEYLDHVITHHYPYTEHERYHDECPKQDVIERLFYSLVREKGDLVCADRAGNKIHVIGFYWDADGIKVEYRDWASPCVNTMPLKELAENYHDAEGVKI